MPVSRLRHHATASAVALLAAAAPASGASLTQALDAAPADAELVVAIPSLAGFSAMIDRLARSAGVDDEGTADVLAAVKRELAVGPGLDDAGAGLFVVRGVADALAAEARGEASPGFDSLLVLPVTDYEAFVAGLEKPAEPSPTPEGVTAVLLGGSDSTVRAAGGYAVLAEGAAATAAYETAGAAAAVLEAMGGYAADAGAPDAAVWVDVAALRPGLEASMDDLAGELAGAGGPGMAGAVTAALSPLYADATRGIVDSVDGVLLTARMTPERVAVDLMARARAGSPVAGFLREGRGDPLGLLMTLPAEPFLTAAANDLLAFDVEAMTEAATDAAGRVAARLQADPEIGAAAGALPAVMEAWAALSTPIEGATASVQVNYASNAQAMMTGGVFQTVSATAAADAEAVRAAFPARIRGLEDELGPALEELMDSLQDAAAADPAAPPTGVGITAEHDAGALTLAGVPVDRYELTFELPAAVTQQAGPAAMVLGNAGMSGFAAAQDGMFLQTASADPALMERALLAGRGGDAVTLAGDPSLTGVAEALPSGLVSFGCLSLQGVAQTVNPFLMMFAPDTPPLEVPEALPPVSYGLGVQPAGGDAAGGHDLGLRLSVPVELIEFARDTYEAVVPADEPAADRVGGGPPAAPF